MLIDHSLEQAAGGSTGAQRQSHPLQALLVFDQHKDELVVCAARGVDVQLHIGQRRNRVSVHAHEQ